MKMPLQIGLRSIAQVLARSGIDRIGIADVAPVPDVRSSLEHRKREGLSAGLGFTFTDPVRSTDIRTHFPWAERFVVLGRAYLPDAGGARSGPGGDLTEHAGGTARVARFAVDDAYAPIRAALEAAAAHLKAAGYRAEVMVDDPGLVDRAVAVRAGLGWWGKNTRVLAPGQGPWMLFGSVVTDAPLETTPPMERDCGTCEACLPACPTGALVAPGILDARLCLAAALQTPGVIPIGLRIAVGDRLYGCDDCLDVCPPGGRLLTAAGKAGSERDRGSHAIRWLLEAEDEDLEARFGHFYLARSSVAMLRRNALVVAGNSNDPSVLPLVVGYLRHPDPVLRAHAVWALRRLSPPWAGALIRDLAAGEADPRVVSELRGAAPRS